MKTARSSMTTVFAAGLVVALSTASLAMDHSAMGHGATGTAMPASHQGAMIHEAIVGGYQAMYHLMTWSERNAAMKGMEGMEMAGMDTTGKATNHLVVYLTAPYGKEVSGAKVGFQVTGPDGTEQKTLTMAMGGGYGADVIMKAKGVYKIKCKFVVGEKATVDEFSYEVK
jgi:hypothetical protein